MESAFFFKISNFSLAIKHTRFKVIVIIALLYSAVLAWNVLFSGPIDSGIGNYGGLSDQTLSQILENFVFLLGSFVGGTQTQTRYYRTPRAFLPSDELSSELKEIIMGLLLGDLHCQKQTPNSNARLLFEQGALHKEYIIHLYDLFKAYCTATLKFTTRFDKRTGKTYERAKFFTLSSPALNEFHSLFYVGKTKVIPSTIGE